MPADLLDINRHPPRFNRRYRGSLKKEIRLQQMAFIVTAGFTDVFITIVVWPRVADDR